MSLLFHGLDPVSSARYTVYHTLVQVAGQVEQIKSVFTDLEKMRTQLAPCKPNNEQMQKLLRILHEVLLNSRERFGQSCLKVSSFMVKNTLFVL